MSVSLMYLNTITHLPCHVQTNNFDGATIKGMVSVDNDHSGENFCGNAGLTTGGSTYVNKVASDSTSSSSSSSASSAGQNAMQKAKNNEHHSAPAPAKKAPASSACAWGAGACGMQIILLL